MFYNISITNQIMKLIQNKKICDNILTIKKTKIGQYFINYLYITLIHLRIIM